MFTKIAVRLTVIVLTFVIGITSTRPFVDQKVTPERISINLKMVNPVGEPKKLKFTPSVRACGMGYSQRYELPTGEGMWERNICHRSPRQARQMFRKLIAESSKVIERNSRHNSRWTEGFEERVVTNWRKDNSVNDWARIIRYGGGDCVYVIEAPTLYLALEFENADTNGFDN